MTCQEVMIDMQRQLDDDLDSFESEALSAHLQHCSECRAMFERLQSLSAELENLPRVTPQYSLVDAILPQLEQIDLRESGERSAGAAPAGDALERMRQEAVRRRRLRDRFSLRALSGVIAAGVVVGLFLVTYDPQSAGDMDNAGTAMESAADSSASSLMMDTSASNDAAPEESSALRMKEAPAAADSDGAADTGNAAGDAPASDASDDELVPMMENAGEGAGGAITSEPAPASPPQSGNQAGSLENEAPQPNDQSPGGVIAEPSGDSDEPASSMQVVPTAEEPAAEEEAVPLASGNNNKSAGQLGIAAEMPEAQAAAVSPDGAYRAVAAGTRVTVFDAATGDELFNSRELAGEIRLAEWSADSKAIEYEIVAPDGASERFRIDVQAGTETKL
jgi:hypothetical protein